MEIEYVREVKDTFMQIESAKKDNYQMKMIMNNHIPGLLEINYRMVNGKTRYLYRISSMINMEDEFHKKNLCFEDLQALIKAFLKLFSSMENFLLDFNGLMLTPDTVYKDIRTSEWQFAYFVDKESDFEDDMKEFFEYIIRNVNHKDIRAVTMAYGIYKRICEGNFNPSELFEYEEKDDIEEGEIICKREPVETIIPEVTEDEEEIPDDFKIRMIQIATMMYVVLVIYIILGVFIEKFRINNCGAGMYVFILLVLVGAGYWGYRWFKNNKNLLVKKVIKQVQIPYEKEHIKVILPRKEQEEAPTMLLSDIPQRKEHMLKWQEKSGEKEFFIKEIITLIGSSADRADCVINREGISRIHARITNEDSRYYIKDMNSTNGTKVNGKELACYELCEIKSQDIIEFGNFECIFI